MSFDNVLIGIGIVVSLLVFSRVLEFFIGPEDNPGPTGYDRWKAKRKGQK